MYIFILNIQQIIYVIKLWNNTSYISWAWLNIKKPFSSLDTYPVFCEFYGVFFIHYARALLRFFSIVLRKSTKHITWHSCKSYEISLFKPNFFSESGTKPSDRFTLLVDTLKGTIIFMLRLIIPALRMFCLFPNY